MNFLKTLTSPLIVILAAVLIRLFPHLPNFAPIGAMALYGGAYLNKKYSIIIVFVTMLISDYLLLYVSPFSSNWLNFSKIYPPTSLFHSSTLYVYGSFMIYYLIGRAVAKRKSVATVGIGALAASLQFFLITNAAVWINGAYARDISGLWQSYVMGIPFFRGTLLGDLFYTGMFFGGYEFIKKVISARGPATSGFPTR